MQYVLYIIVLRHVGDVRHAARKHLLNAYIRVILFFFFFMFCISLLLIQKRSPVDSSICYVNYREREDRQKEPHKRISSFHGFAVALIKVLKL